MMRLCRSGTYKLIETRRNIRILYLNNTAYAWIEPWSNKEILVISRRSHITDCILSMGSFRLYDVKDELRLPGKQLLTLEVGADIWQGYLLPTGLPTARRKRVRILIAHQVVIGSVAFSDSARKPVYKGNDKRKERFHEVTHSL